MTPRAKPPQMVQQTSSHQQSSNGPPTARILYLRDNTSTEAHLVRKCLAATDNLRLAIQEVSGKHEFKDALRLGSWELVLCDYESTTFPGEEALALVLAECPEIPVIMLTSEPSEKEMLRVLEAGAREYVLKDHLQRLIPSIRRVLKESMLERELHEKEEKYLTLFTSMDEGYCIIEVIFDEAEKAIDYRFLETNPAFEKHTGLADVIGKRVRELIPALENYWPELYGRVALTGEPVRVQMAAEPLHRYYSVYAYRFGRPEEHKVAVLFSDIHERLDLEERIEHIARFPGENPHPILRVAPEGKLLYANTSSAVILKVWNCSEGQYVPDGWREIVRRALERGTDESLDMEFDGTIYAFTVVPVAEGPYVNLYGRDITRRKEMEAKLLSSQREKTELLESIVDPTYGLDSEWRFTYINTSAAKFMGKTQEELLGRNIWDVFPVGRDSESARQLQRAMTERVVLHYEVQAAVNKIWVDVHVFPKADGGLSVLYRDIHQRKETEAQIAADVAALKTMHYLSQRVLETASIEPLFQEITDAAVEIARAQKGTLRLLEGDTLCLVAQHGHEEPFLTYFAKAEAIGPIFDEVNKYHKQLLVPDLEKSPLFVGRPSLPKILEAGVRAVQVTPLLNRSGELLGVLSTQWSEPYTPGEQDLWRIDLLARQAADLIEFKKSAEAIQESEQRFRTLANTIPQLAWWANADGYITWYNDNWYCYTGTTPEEMKGWGWQSVHDPNVLPAVLERWKASIATGEPFEMVFPLRGADGRFRPFLTRVQPLRDASRQVVQWFGTNTDIDELKRAEEALRESEDRFRTMADSTPVMIWVTNAQGEIDLVNHAYEQFFGVTEAQVKAPSTWKMLVHPEDEKSYIGAFMAALQKQGPFDAEGRVKHCSGQWRWVHSYGAPRFSKEGKFLGHVGSSPDITAEKLATDALKASELNLKLMVSQAGEAMMVVSPNGVIEAVSPLGTRVLGYHEGELVGRNVAEFAETFSRLDAVLTVEELRKKAPHPISTTVRVRTKNGGQSYFFVMASFVSLGTNTEKYFVRFHKVELPTEGNGSKKEGMHLETKTLFRP